MFVQMCHAEMQSVKCEIENMEHKILEEIYTIDVNANNENYINA